MSQAKFYSDYSRYLDDKGRYETWAEAVERVMNMHRKFYADVMTPELNAHINYAEKAYKKSLILGSQRNLQFGGDQILKHHARSYNCSYSKVDRPDFFESCMYLLLCGCGVGFSVQKHHVAQLSSIKRREGEPKVFQIPDSIEGWAHAFGVLISSFFTDGGTHPEYQGCPVHFDFSKIRPKGAYISGGFKAPGPDGLRQSLQRCEDLLLSVAHEKPVKMKPIVIYDFTMHMADAVLSGGLRRCLPQGSKVFLKNGVKNIEDVGVGDKVLTPHGYYRVRNRFNQGVQQTIKLITQDGSFECTPNHRMAVINGFESYEWKKAEDITENDKLITNTFPIEGGKTSLPSFTYIRPEKSTTCKDITIPELDNDMAWFIGYFHGDGYVKYNPDRRGANKNSNNSITFKAAISDTNIINKAKAQIERFGVYASFKASKNENTYRVQVTSRQLSQYFYENIKQPKSELQVPDFIWNASQEIKLSYVSGLLDSDGSSNNKPINICSTVYNNYAKDVQNLLYSCGISTRLKGDIKRKEEGWQDINYLSLINKSDCEKLRNPSLVSSLKTNKITRLGNRYCSEHITENRNFKGSKSSLGAYSNSNVSVDRIEEYGHKVNLRPVEVKSKEVCRQVETYDIEVEEVNQFYCNGYLTHNSASIALFSYDDEQMTKAKTGNWFINNPQRARSNNSAMLKRDEVTKEQFNTLLSYTKEYGEPGFLFVDDYEHGANPCQPKWAKFLTPSGIRELGEISIGDKIWSKEGWTTVTNKWSTGIKPVYKFETISGRFYGTEDHKVVSNGEKVQVKNAYFIDCSEPRSKETESQPILNRKYISEEEVFDITVDNKSHTYWTEGCNVSNCVEIGFPGHTPDGRSGWSMCNLSEINGGACTDQSTFYTACEAGAILGTLQAGYTDFPFLQDATEEIVEHEALLGVSITGWMNNPHVLFDEETLEKGADLVKRVNKRMAELININPAARCTTVKPSGNASVILRCASGIHGEHAPAYIRNVQINENSEVLKTLERTNPKMVEKSIWSSTGTDKVVSFPVKPPENSIYKADLYGIRQLEYVKLAQAHWVATGTRLETSIDSRVRHNVSNTITVDDWDAVADYIFKNRNYFAGISMMSELGDRVLPQSPFTQVYTAQEILDMYGEACMFASGLIVDALHAFNNNLWTACSTVEGKGEDLGDQDSSNVLKHDWVRRAKKFANNFFSGDLSKMSSCLKDCYNLHRWHSINNNYRPVDFNKQLQKKTYTDADTLGAASCSGGACEIEF